MAWRSHGHDAASLADALARNGVLRSERAAAAMRAVDRGHYLPRGRAGSAYEDAPQPIGHGVTISAPHMHAAALDLLEAQLRPGAAALDVGSGTGYLTACMAHMVRGTGARGDSSGVAVGIDHIDALVEGSRRNVRADPAAHELEQDGALELVCGDGRQGYSARAPYDAIHVGAASPVRPDALIAQLAKGGRLVVPVGPEGGGQELKVYDRSASTGEVEEWTAMGVIYVPLCDKDYQLAKA